ncbi:Niemann-Pick C1 protein [Armadillidium nasatum]|uniref:Niemann-Pick C1 protein n=1 Tax=Armadillidium nasatum TaxID=96803 RepID=A0A5N5SUP6_9CRUS|nr:Niemann-Pick C1 protein [Armadillidium nasatum]
MYVEGSQYGKSIRTCCDSYQIDSLKNQLSLAESFLKRCPTCIYNFRQTFCYLTCAPYQNRFMVANETVDYS